jgi:hypothetical protein
MNEKLKECIKQKKANPPMGLRDLITCINKDPCDSKLSFGDGYFCRLSPLYEKPEKVKA